MWYFFFASPGTWLLTGLGLASWAIGAATKSATRSIIDGHPKLDSISVSCQKSKGGKCHIKNYGFYSPLKKYVAEVVCPELQSERMVVADSEERLEQLILKEFKSMEEDCTR